ncbi:hypothetical protein DIPPA_22930 [Diplonema papillatum]|nr:hypothetical protein DIPPA_22930 [Diplonema papillatum]
MMMFALAPLAAVSALGVFDVGAIPILGPYLESSGINRELRRLRRTTKGVMWCAGAVLLVILLSFAYPLLLVFLSTIGSLWVREQPQLKYLRFRDTHTQSFKALAIDITQGSVEALNEIGCAFLRRGEHGINRIWQAAAGGRIEIHPPQLLGILPLLSWDDVLEVELTGDTVDPRSHPVCRKAVGGGWYAWLPFAVAAAAAAAGLAYSKRQRPAPAAAPASKLAATCYGRLYSTWTDSSWTRYSAEFSAGGAAVSLTATTSRAQTHVDLNGARFIEIKLPGPDGQPAACICVAHPHQNDILCFPLSADHSSWLQAMAASSFAEPCRLPLLTVQATLVSFREKRTTFAANLVPDSKSLTLAVHGVTLLQVALEKLEYSICADSGAVSVSTGVAMYPTLTFSHADTAWWKAFFVGRSVICRDTIAAAAFPDSTCHGFVRLSRNAAQPQFALAHFDATSGSFTYSFCPCVTGPATWPFVNTSWRSTFASESPVTVAVSGASFDSNHSVLTLQTSGGDLSIFPTIDDVDIAFWRVAVDQWKAKEDGEAFQGNGWLNSWWSLAASYTGYAGTPCDAPATEGTAAAKPVDVSPRPNPPKAPPPQACAESSPQVSPFGMVIRQPRTLSAFAPKDAE